MDPVVGAVLAAAVAWLSILIAVRIPLPDRLHANSPRGIRRLGGLTIALFALQVFGLPIPFWVPLAFFGAGLALLLLLSSSHSDHHVESH